MPLRTYSLIVHPAFHRFVEGAELHEAPEWAGVPPAQVPAHRPKIEHVYDIAAYLGITPDIVRSAIKFKYKHYRSFSFRKRKGGYRSIDAPRLFAKVIQWWILDSILSHSYVHEFVHGFVRGRSFIGNARSHVGAKHILNVDIKDFFPSIEFSLVKAVFEKLGYSPSVSESLAELTTYKGVLPQGAPTSPAIANLVFEELDLRLVQIAEGHGLVYTRYADDLTFSGGARIPESLVEEISSCIWQRKFILNVSKTRFMGPNQTKEVTGLIIGRDGICLSRSYLNSARGWFHAIVKAPENHSLEARRVRGTLDLIKQIGGRGSTPVINLGEKALMEITRGT